MRRSRKIKKEFLLLLFCVGALQAIAQGGYKYMAAVNKVDAPGFYKISLQPALVAKGQPGLFDLRLSDSNRRFIPFVNASNVPVNGEQQFMVFPTVGTSGKADTGTSIVVENTSGQPIGRIWIKLKNTAVIRTMNISGSDDLKHWFAIEEGMPLQESNLTSDGAYIQSLNFPSSNYHYLKILVNDKNKTPVRFLGAGIYFSPSVNNSYQSILSVAVAQHDSAKTSWITIRLDDKYQVNKLHLNIKGPKYFKRDVSVYDASGKTPVLISESEISSADNNDFLLSAKTNRLILKIDNADNIPLVITGAEAWQTDQYIISYLEAGQPYYLLIGNPNTEQPNYDLKFFTDSIGNHFTDIGHGPVMKNPAYAFQTAAVKPGHPMLIWLAIAVALVLLTFLTLKMVKEVNAKTGTN